ncbi:MAG TPA: T9SS type A sorting domain-containing protein [Bacteroidia bacterium]|nr:T9SS type A sorting domain-containing protein [Bacteroidia bacterium]
MNPNPSTGKVLVKLQNADEKMVSLHVYNSTGNLVLFEPVNGNSFELNFEELREGIYFVRTVNDKNQVFSKSFNILR